MELTESLKSILIDTAKQLKDSARRVFMARIVKELDPGGASRAERELGWNRKTVRKGIHEVESSIICLDAFAARGRKLAEEHLPNLLVDIKAIVDGQSQTDPQFKTTRLYTRLTAVEVRRQLITLKGYRDEELPTATTIGSKLNQLGYCPTKVVQSANPKKLPDTDAIFEELGVVNAAADTAAQTLRISMDAKATVKVGDFSRGGKKRVRVKAATHDAQTEGQRDPSGHLGATIR